MNPRDKVILVTGASDGIGLAAARALGRAGAKVALAARTLPRLEAAAQAMREEGVEALAVALDVTADASVAAGVEAVLARFGRIDAVIGCAGNGGHMSAWLATAEDATRAMFDVHVFGAERVARGVVPAMLAQGGGTIVHIASTVAWVPMPNAAAYSAAKAALVSFSTALRGELAASNIDVCVFAPPHTRTAAGLAWPLEGPQMFEVDWVADELVRTLKRGRASHLAGASNRALLLLGRLSPSLATRIMRGIGLRAGQKALLPARSSAA
jgi:short-subunit dehydrogenase